MFRAAVLTLAALDALLGIDLVRLAQLAAYSADGAQSCTLGTADALERVDPHGAQAAANAGRALFVLNVGDVLVLEVFERAQNRVRSGFAETAQRAGLDDSGKLLKHINVLKRAAAVGYALEYRLNLGDTFAAGGALSAGLLLGEVHEEARYFDHAGIVAHDDKTARADYCADLLGGFKVERQIEMLLSETAAGGAADLHGLELLSARDAAADVVDDLTDGRRILGDIHIAGICNIAFE